MQNGQDQQASLAGDNSIAQFSAGSGVSTSTSNPVKAKPKRSRLTLRCVDLSGVFEHAVLTCCVRTLVAIGKRHLSSKKSDDDEVGRWRYKAEMVLASFLVTDAGCERVCILIHSNR
jgi:hypothetical protein